MKMGITVMSKLIEANFSYNFAVDARLEFHVKRQSEKITHRFGERSYNPFVFLGKITVISAGCPELTSTCLYLKGNSDFKKCSYQFPSPELLLYYLSFYRAALKRLALGIHCVDKNGVSLR
jgi:hypothetical protein